MRITGAGAIFGLLLAAAGCKDKAEGSSGNSEAIAASGELESKQAEILKRRDSLLKNRQQLRENLAALDQERARVVAAGGDTTEIDEKKAALDKELSGLDQQETEINTAVTDLLAEQRAMTQALAAGGGVTAREAAIAEREKSIKDREARIAQREAEVAQREKEAVKFKLEQCATPAAATTIIQTVDAKGSQYTKRDVEPLLSKARSEMSRKGLLHSDLPPAGQGLEKEATSAMKEGDYGRARFAAQQLVATVRSTDITKGLVAAKIGRLSAAIRGKTLEPKVQADVDKLFAGATANVADGKFSDANRKLNRIYSLID